MAIMTPKELGARVREIREARGLTQEQVAELTDLATDTVRRIELGYYGPSFSTMVKIAVGFGLTVGQLMRDEVDPATSSPRSSVRCPTATRRPRSQFSGRCTSTR